MSEPIQSVVPETPSGPKAPTRRRAVVLIAVLVIVASLSLAGYHYSDSMTSEYKASENAHNAQQARAAAAAGIHYAAAMLSNSNNYNNLLAGNPWNNSEMFQNISVDTDQNYKGRFTIFCAPAPDDNTDPSVPYYGVIDESRKINPNALMKMDKGKGQLLYTALMAIPNPNMTSDIAYNIVAWMGGSAGITNGGAGNDYYMGLSPPYRAKNGPLDSIDELLMVKDVTRDLLYGSDYNRNGTYETANESGPNGYDPGLAAYLTVFSREQNSDQYGNPFIYLQNTDLQQMYQLLLNGTDGTNGVDINTATFIVLYCQYGPQALGNAVAKGNPSVMTVQGDLGSAQLDFTKKGSNKINTLYDLIGAKVSVSSNSKDDKGKSVTTITNYASPITASNAATTFTKLYAITTNTDPTQSTEIPARINILTAPRSVLMTLTALVPALLPTDIDNIIAARPPLSTSAVADPSFSSPIWLMGGQVNLKASTLASLDKYITTRSQVYRVQSVGYFDDRKISVRIEAVIDANAGRPRILMWRELSELGKGLSDPSMPTPTPPTP